ncbi:MFS transporter [Microlunatus soli]|uniref:Predicted arabinose efflux permease, MFS family n=1 Tax=Microlunatus soli TaxID=630515 RepID=A0A1H1ZBF2_9ACTN|nr:MFS transporter [Microlunatus soli]SDT30822.1 Predicted arabinose efflux permease, MFS family [Microlunatus soli]
MSARERRRVAVATVVGTTIEWYDFFIYANAAGLVFQSLFFKPAGPQLSILLSFATVGISFLFRPLGAALAGHFGDRVGRKLMLVLTLLCMGLATTLIGLLPTYATIGVLAPVLLIVLRILQGVSAGGEWGGAVLMAVEHAPDGKRGRYGMFPQLGVPIGMLAASGILALMTGVIAPGAAFAAWGWRVPFLLSFVLIIVGYIVRRSVAESPVFTEIAEQRKQTRMPLVELFRRHWRLVILAALVFAGNNAVGYMTTGGYVLNYASTPKAEGGVLGLDKTSVLLAVSGSAALWLIFTVLAGFLADAIGRRITYLIGWISQLIVVFPLFWLINTGSIGWLFVGLGLLSIGLGLTYGPQPAWYAEIFPASIRFSGVAVSYAIGAIVGGAFAPTISTALVQRFHTTQAVSFYLLIMTVIGLTATLLLRDRQGIDLSIESEEDGTLAEGIGR